MQIDFFDFFDSKNGPKNAAFFGLFDKLSKTFLAYFSPFYEKLETLNLLNMTKNISFSLSLIFIIFLANYIVHYHYYSDVSNSRHK